jgi:hypothetical protein
MKLQDLDFFTTEETHDLLVRVFKKKKTERTPEEIRAVALEKELGDMYTRKKEDRATPEDLEILRRYAYLEARKHSDVSDPMRFLTWCCRACPRDEIETMWAPGRSVECPDCKAVFEVKDYQPCPEEGNYIRATIGKRLR